MSIEFVVRKVPEKMYRRFLRYHLWWRHHPALLGISIALSLAMLAFIVVSCIRSDDLFDSMFWMFWFVLMLRLSEFMAQMNGRNLSRREYAFREEDFTARTHEIYQAWKYSALAYAREAKDAFYLVLNEKTGEAMVIPKEALAPEQCATLAEVLQKGAPEGKFTRWKGAERP